MAAEREFIVCMERNTKQQEVFIYYLQWTTNEETILRLNKAIQKANYAEKEGGDYSELRCDLDKKLPESVVDAHIGLKDMNSYFPMFTKCTGTFTFHLSEEEIDETEECNLASILDIMFYGCKMPEMFSEYRDFFRPVRIINEL